MFKWTEEEKTYIENIAEEYGLDLEAVYAMANLLGREELYDGLVSCLKDATFYNYR